MHKFFYYLFFKNLPKRSKSFPMRYKIGLLDIKLKWIKSSEKENSTKGKFEEIFWQKSAIICYVKFKFIHMT